MCVVCGSVRWALCGRVCVVGCELGCVCAYGGVCVSLEVCVVCVSQGVCELGCVGEGVRWTVCVGWGL